MHVLRYIVLHGQRHLADIFDKWQPSCIQSPIRGSQVNTFVSIEEKKKKSTNLGINCLH